MRLRSSDPRVEASHGLADDEESTSWDREASRRRSLAFALADASMMSEIAVDHVARAGVAGTASTLPHQDTIQEAFGRHDVGSVKAHLDERAVDAANDLGAVAYALGDSVAFAREPDLHTAAHEAAHVVQAAHGVHLRGG